MYQLVLLTPEPPNFRNSFLPYNKINDEPPKGLTYGVDIQEYPYSQTLRDLVQECFYEKPGHRPSLIDLKRRVLKGLETSMIADESEEPWEDFLPAEPAPAPAA